MPEPPSRDHTPPPSAPVPRQADAGLFAGWRGYAFAAGATLATLALRLLLAPWVGSRPTMVLFVLPILAGAFAGGLGPGLFATALSGLGIICFFIPHLSGFSADQPADEAQWAIFVVVGIVVSVIAEAMRRTEGIAGGGAEPDQFHSAEWKVRAGFAVSLSLLAVIGSISYASVDRLFADLAWVRHSEEVGDFVDGMQSSLKEAITVERAYVISGDESYLGEPRKCMRALPPGGNWRGRRARGPADNRARRGWGRSS